MPLRDLVHDRVRGAVDETGRAPRAQLRAGQFPGVVPRRSEAPDGTDFVADPATRAIVARHAELQTASAEEQPAVGALPERRVAGEGRPHEERSAQDQGRAPPFRRADKALNEPRPGRLHPAHIGHLAEPATWLPADRKPRV